MCIRDRLYAERKKLPSGIEWVWMGINGLLFAIYFAMRSSAIADAGNLSILAFFKNTRSLLEESFKMIVPLGYSVMPVSYTHLDVYKRQT